MLFRKAKADAGTKVEERRLRAQRSRTWPWHPSLVSKQGFILSNSMSTASCNFATRRSPPPYQFFYDSSPPPASHHHSSTNKLCSHLSLTPTEPVSNSFWLFPHSFYRSNTLRKIFLTAFIFPLLLSPLILIKHSMVVRVEQGGFLSLSVKNPTKNVSLISHQHKISFHYTSESASKF